MGVANEVSYPVRYMTYRACAMADAANSGTNILSSIWIVIIIVGGAAEYKSVAATPPYEGLLQMIDRVEGRMKE